MGFEYVDHQLWDSEGFNALSPPGKLLYLWAWTNGAGRLAGVFKALPTKARTDTGISLRQQQMLVTSPELRKMLRYFEDGCWWWTIYKAERAVHGKNQVSGVLSQLRGFGHRCPVVEAFAAAYGINPWRPPASLPPVLAVEVAWRRGYGGGTEGVHPPPGLRNGTEQNGRYCTVPGSSAADLPEGPAATRGGEAVAKVVEYLRGRPVEPLDPDVICSSTGLDRNDVMQVLAGLKASGWLRPAP